MQLVFSVAIPIEAIIQAFVWTLIHSLWLGVFVSVITACILYATKESKALLRYNLLAATLLVFVVGIIVSFCSQLSAAKQHGHNAVQLTAQNTLTNQLQVPQISTEGSSSVTELISLFITNHASWLFSGWALTIVFLFMKMALGLYRVHRIRNHAIINAPAYWNNKVMELGKLLKLKKPFKLLQSGIVDMPVVIGFLKPVILMPASILTSLSANEIEAILLHELAHIKRNDFIVNIVQNVLEIIFFFNPSVLWISSLIKNERENCCDDIALEHTENKYQYIKALVSFQELSSQTDTRFAMGLTGDKNYLLNRVKRIIYNKNKTLDIMEKKFLSAGLVLAVVCFCALISIKAQTVQNSKSDKTNLTSQVNDTIPRYKIGGNTNMTGTTHTFFEGKEYNIVIKNSIVTELVIDGKKIPAEKIVDYKDILDKIHSKMIASSEKARKDSEQAMRDSEKAMKDSDQAKRDSEKTMKDSDQEMRDSEKAMKDSEQAMRDSEKAMKDSEQAMRESEKAMKDSEQALKEMDSLIDELIAAKIIKQRSELKSLSLNITELLVNGVKQPAAIHKKLKDKYVKSETTTIVYKTE